MSGKENNNIVIIPHPTPSLDEIKAIDFERNLNMINPSGGYFPIGGPVIHNLPNSDNKINNLELYNPDRVVSEEQMNAMISGTNLFTNNNIENDIAFASAVTSAMGSKYLKNVKYNPSFNGSTDGPPREKRAKAKAKRKKKNNAKRKSKRNR